MVVHVGCGRLSAAVQDRLCAVANPSIQPHAYTLIEPLLQSFPYLQTHVRISHRHRALHVAIRCPSSRDCVAVAVLLLLLPLLPSSSPSSPPPSSPPPPPPLLPSSSPPPLLLLLLLLLVLCFIVLSFAVSSSSLSPSPALALALA